MQLMQEEFVLSNQVQNQNNRTLKHIAIIPDGNRRWANQRELPPKKGHQKGFLDVTPSILEAIWDKSIFETTLWLFSTDNWQRQEHEVRDLMDIFERLFHALLPLVQKRSVQMRHIGRKDRIPKNLLNTIKEVELSTKGNTEYIFNFALDYGGKDEIIRAIQNIIQNSGNHEDLNGNLLKKMLGTVCQPQNDPDLIIRTSGEYRLSGFMPLQSCYSELYFTNTLYPDLNPAELQRAIDFYYCRNRRFGK